MEEIKLVICDIDWTLLSRKNRVLSEYTISVLEEIHKKGICFGLASGRPIDEVLPVYDKWGLSFPCDVIISMNGGEVLDGHTGKFYEYYKLKKEWIKEIVEMTAPLNVNPYMYYHGSLKSMRYDADIEGACQRNRKSLIVAKDIDDFADEDNGKIMIRIKEEQMEEFEKYIKQFPSPYYQEFKTQKTLMEFCDRRVSKGQALINYCGITGLDIKHVMAFGDTTNDNQMIQNAGWGVCLLNGSDDTKAVADAITDVDVENDGVAHYIEKYLLKRG